MTVEAAAPPAPETPATPGKVDPEMLALRAQPARAIRFKRGAIVAIAALGSVSLIATAWVALGRPHCTSLDKPMTRQPRRRRQPIRFSRIQANRPTNGSRWFYGYRV